LVRLVEQIEKELDDAIRGAAEEQKKRVEELARVAAAAAAAAAAKVKVLEAELGSVEYLVGK